ncbi:hypothetical protein PHLGIDRAFT_116123 [Phlebiopsis gigantea 11061_1 CR5-6]|uniref:Uncharacterized protein n=1 Tax=Phlebiopsis gigantea (strain 11061_1 CR5-6) TaxID=745531 RepID=A0A0C3SB03_PHLG1|nr:hypothetical protein PHLGIDRAFT_116123 [Phlebiopsis gigantea 11061_1 CR5-6]
MLASAPAKIEPDALLRSGTPISSHSARSAQAGAIAHVAHGPLDSADLLALRDVKDADDAHRSLPKQQPSSRGHNAEIHVSSKPQRSPLPTHALLLIPHLARGTEQMLAHEQARRVARVAVRPAGHRRSAPLCDDGREAVGEPPVRVDDLGPSPLPRGDAADYAEGDPPEAHALLMARLRSTGEPFRRSVAEHKLGQARTCNQSATEPRGSRYWARKPEA